MNEYGRLWVAIAIAVGVIVLLFVACDSMFDDSDETDDLGQGTELVASRNGNGGGDCAKAEAECSDDDFSPTFDKSPVEDSFNLTVCVMPGSCTDETA